MSKNIRRIVYAAAAVVVLALAFVIMKYAFPEKEVIIEETPVPTEEPVYYLVRRSGNEVSELLFRYEDGSEEVLNFLPFVRLCPPAASAVQSDTGTCSETICAAAPASTASSAAATKLSSSRRLSSSRLRIWRLTNATKRSNEYARVARAVHAAVNGAGTN